MYDRSLLYSFIVNWICNIFIISAKYNNGETKKFLNFLQCDGISQYIVFFVVFGIIVALSFLIDFLIDDNKLMIKKKL